MIALIYTAAFAFVVAVLAAMILALVSERRARRIDDEHERRRRMRTTIDQLLEAAYRADLRDEVQA